MLNYYQQFCHDRKQQELYRQLPPPLNDHLLDFASNDYLALARSSLLYKAALEAAQTFGVGSTGSRLLSGNSTIFDELETKIANAKNTETALIMASGFQANSSVLGSLLNQSVLPSKPLVFFDKLNHASLYQAIFLSQAELIRYHHNDMTHLNDLLEKFQNSKRPKFIVTETVFGMDGDKAPIEEIIHLTRQHQAFLYLDEAHATGIFGHQGYGVSTDYVLTGIPHLIMGTFSKALGSFGAYIASSTLVKEYLLNACPGFIYSTAPSPMLIGAALKAWELIPSLAQQRQALLARAASLRDQLQVEGFNIGTSTTHIMSIIVNSERIAIEAQKCLYECGIRVSAIRPPTVPPHSGRLRIALSTQHTPQNCLQLIHALKKHAFSL